MSESNTEKANNTATAAEDAPLVAESQRERWVKYGANVALSCVLVLVLAGIIIWAAQRKSHRTDLTSNAAYSLKPQTVSILQSLNADNAIKLVSLYPRLQQDKSKVGTEQDFRQPVVDILEEYKRKGKNIEIETIDPVAEPAKLDLWIQEITRKYGGDVKAYRDLLEAFPVTLVEIKKIADAQSTRMKSLQSVRFVDDEQVDTVNTAYSTVQLFPELLGRLDQQIKDDLAQKIPDYKGAVAGLRTGLSLFSRQVSGVTAALRTLKDNPKAPAEARAFSDEAVPQFEEMGKKADTVLANIKSLGDLKLDELRKKLIPSEDGAEPPPAIAVMGQHDIKMISFEDVWTSGAARGMNDTASPRLRFAGEQRLTTAILAMTEPKKTRVAFVREGGAPLANAMFQGPFTDIAERLQADNFEVVEKDLSGTFAMQAQQRRMPAPPEATDEQLKDAVWVVISDEQQFGMPGSGKLDEALARHLKQGGSALCLFNLRSNGCDAALSQWGVKVRTDRVAVHELVESAAGPSDDYVENARRQPLIFVLNEYADHPITRSLQSLDSALVPIIPVETPGAPGCRVTALISVPQQPRSWGEKDMERVFRANAKPLFDAAGGDLPGPLLAGAAVEKDGAGRLVVMGSMGFASNDLLRLPDQKMAEKYNRAIARFPANGELFTNSVFWLARNEKLMALSPTALEVNRISPMSAGMLNFWRVGVLLIGLPAAVVLAGLWVYMGRKD